MTLDIKPTKAQIDRNIAILLGGKVINLDTFRKIKRYRELQKEEGKCSKSSSSPSASV